MTHSKYHCTTALTKVFSSQLHGQLNSWPHLSLPCGAQLSTDCSLGTPELQRPFKVKLTLRLEVYRQSVRLGFKSLETHGHRFLSQLNPCNHSPYATHSLTRRCGCILWICTDRSESESESESHVTTDSQSASLSWYKAPIRGLRPDIY
jgi:hypothetical protein